MNISTIDRFTGCLLGGAIGDALGGAVEFMHLSQIRRTFGPDGLTDYAPAYGRFGAITDDTQMTLFTAEGLIQAHDRGQERGLGDPTAMVHVAYLRWLATQGHRSSHPLFDPHPTRGFATLPEMNRDRAPGTTCLRALEGPVAGVMEPPLNDSKGCGGVMRIAPVGLCFAEPFETACKIAALTHGHPAGYLAAGTLAMIISQIDAGASIFEGLLSASAELAKWPRHEGTMEALWSAHQLAEQGDPSPEKVEQLGEGWIAEEALAIGVYCALVASDFEHGVLLAVNHSGDSDSTGSITGNILGALWGRQTLPERWLAGLELRPEIEDLAVELHSRYGTSV
ncbi:MAG: ADP-ribosylglycohydrolase family protein [Armatimonadota bacterium]